MQNARFEIDTGIGRCLLNPKALKPGRLGPRGKLKYIDLCKGYWNPQVI